MITATTATPWNACRATSAMALGALALTLSVGCSDSTSSSDDSGTGGSGNASSGTGGSGNTSSGTGGSAGAAGSTSMEPPVYMLQTLFQTPDGRTVLVHLVNDLEAPLDRSKAIEFSGASRARVGLGKLFTFDSETLEVTKWDVGDDLVPVELDKFSMQPTGITGFNGNVTFISETKAININGGARAFIVWNPETMEIVTTVPFTSDFPPSIRSGQAVLSEDGELLYVPLMGLDLATLDTVPGAHVAVFSTSSNTVEKVAVDTRAPGGDGMFVHPQTGDFIYVGDGLGGFARYFATPNDVAPALLRIKKGETSFDPDWMKTGSELNSRGFSDIGGFGGLLALGDRFVMATRDEDLSADPSTFQMNPFDFLRESVYSIFAGPLDDWLATPVTGADGDNVIFASYNVDGRFIAAGQSGKLYFINEQNALVEFNQLTVDSASLERVARLR